MEQLKARKHLGQAVLGQDFSPAPAPQGSPVREGDTSSPAHHRGEGKLGRVCPPLVSQDRTDCQGRAQDRLRKPSDLSSSSPGAVRPGGRTVSSEDICLPGPGSVCGSGLESNLSAPQTVAQPCPVVKEPRTHCAGGL